VWSPELAPVGWPFFRRFLAIVAPLDGFGSCDGPWPAGPGAADGEAGAVRAADRTASVIRKRGDGLDGSLVHLSRRDVKLACFSRAPIGRLTAYKRRMRWQFP